MFHSSCQPRNHGIQIDKILKCIYLFSLYHDVNYHLKGIVQFLTSSKNTQLPKKFNQMLLCKVLAAPIKRLSKWSIVPAMMR